MGPVTLHESCIPRANQMYLLKKAISTFLPQHPSPLLDPTVYLLWVHTFDVSSSARRRLIPCHGSKSQPV